MNTLLLFLAALSLHRIWNYEDIAAPVRARFPWKPFACAACNPFWIALLISVGGLSLGLIPWPVAVVFPFAAYLPVRATVWAYDRIEGVPANLLAGRPAAPAKACTSCAQKQADLAVQREKALAYKERIVIFTAETQLRPQTGALAGLLAKNKERLVQVWLSSATLPEQLSEAQRVLAQLGDNVVARAIVPFVRDERKDQLADEKIVAQLSGEIGMQLMNLGNAKIVTSNILYDPHLLPLAQAIHQFGQTKAFAWVHVVDGWLGWDRPTNADVAAARAAIPPRHFVVVPASAVEVAAHYYAVPEHMIIGAPDLPGVVDAVAAAQPLV